LPAIGERSSALTEVGSTVHVLSAPDCLSNLTSTPPLRV
jgi:hypothetical protein